MKTHASHNDHFGDTVFIILVGAALLAYIIILFAEDVMRGAVRWLRSKVSARASNAKGKS